MKKAISAGVLKIAGIEMKTAVLEDGTRVIDAVDMARFFDALGHEDVTILPDEMEELGRFIHGVSQDKELPPK